MSNLRLAVYSICRDELKHIDNYFKYRDKADEIIILDTGSTDGSYEKLLEYQDKFPNKIKIYREEIDRDNFSFAKALNEALNKVSEDIDICFRADMDEYLQDEGWREAVENLANKNPNWQILSLAYSYRIGLAVGHHDRFHRRKGCHWESIVHEFLVFDEPLDPSRIYHDGSKLWVQHYPGERNDKEHRIRYLNYINKSLEENPYNLSSLYWKIWELKDHYSIQQAIKHLIETCLLLKNYQIPDNYNNTYYSTYVRPGIFYLLLSQFVNLNCMYEYLGALDRFAIDAYYYGAYDLAYKLGEMACKLNPEDSRLSQNLIYYKQKLC